jgi:phosphohistidine swiveling domain-containing protein
VAREYGLPTIVNVKGATKLLKDGDYIIMDAGKGTISIPE